ncbi:hypothetical protein ACGFIK_05090 [Micromonospora sp. NPDC048871]|uniref:hypothetical protein n=1 Tax=unclassified Micromonospora TaxID=2617518 RepID=UPI002E0E8564|nr:hypothetical protein OIE53_05295 [Micromonospora sp. NBC_01739]
MIETLAAVVGALGVFSAGVALLATRSVPTALGVLLDLLVAAGLLRLAAVASWSALVGVVVIVAVRQMLRAGLLATERWRASASSSPAGPASSR